MVRIQFKLDYDIVSSNWRQLEVHKRTGRKVTFPIEGNEC